MGYSIGIIHESVHSPNCQSGTIALYTLARFTGFSFLMISTIEGHEVSFVIHRRIRRDIVLAPSIHTFCLSGTISHYLMVGFDSFLVQMISTMDFRYPISLVKIDPLTLELLPLF